VDICNTIAVKLDSFGRMYIGTTSIIIILCIEIAIGVESVFGQQGVDSEDPSELVEITVLANKFCPPGFIVDESGYCDPEKSSLGPSVGSTGGRENITSEISEIGLQVTMIFLHLNN
jgi:hypothetical protein